MNEEQVLIIFAGIIFIWFAFLIAKELLVKFELQSSNPLFVGKRSRIAPLQLIFNIMPLVLYNRTENKYFDLVFIILLVISTLYLALKVFSKRIITEDGILDSKRKYPWDDIADWHWQGNTLCIDTKRNFKIVGPIYNYMEITVPEEKKDFLDNVFKQYTSQKHSELL